MVSTLVPKGDGLILYIVTVVMLALSWITVITRCCVRRMIKAYGLDDALMIGGLITFSVVGGLILAFCNYGGGYYRAEVTQDHVSKGTKLVFVSQPFYCVTTILVKASICIALLRICGSRHVYRYILWAILAVATISGVVTIIALLLMCRPIPAMWGEVEGTCDTKMNSRIGYFISASSIVTDWSLAVLPAILLWNIQLKRRIKVSVTFILALAAFASCATIVRLRYLLYYDNPNEFLNGSAKIAIWSILEVGIGIFAGSLPHLRPLLRHLPFVSKSSYAGGSHPHGQNSTAIRGRSGTVKMDTFRSHTTGAGGDTSKGGAASRHVETVRARIQGKDELDLEGGSDNDTDSQRHILDGEQMARHARSETSPEAGIRKQTDVTVATYDRDPDEDPTAGAQAFPIQGGGTGGAHVWRG